MYTGKGRIDEILISGERAAQISCHPGLIPAPGRYLLAHAEADSSAPLPHPVFNAGYAPDGFYAAAPIPSTWLPGLELNLQGPFGRGFNVPTSARKIALVAASGSASRLLSLLEQLLAQKAEIVILSIAPLENLPRAIEILPLSALPETAPWADYLALDLPRHQLEFTLEKYRPILLTAGVVELLVETPLPCGGIAECGVCAVRQRKGYALACKAGPVFTLTDF